MNAGGAFGCIGDAVQSVTCLTPRRRARHLSGQRAAVRVPRARTSPTRSSSGAVFDLTAGDPHRDPAASQGDLRVQEEHSQPLAEHSAGCAFKNPIDPVTEKRVSAGRSSTRRGSRDGPSAAPPCRAAHANFIITQPGATAQDVLSLMELIRATVFDHCGLELEREVVVWRRGDIEAEAQAKEHRVNESRRTDELDVHSDDRLRPSVLVLMGGPDAERQVSLMSGREVAAALRRCGALRRDRGGDRSARGRGARRSWRETPSFPCCTASGAKAAVCSGSWSDWSVRTSVAGPRAAALAMDKLASKSRLIELGFATPRRGSCFRTSRAIWIRRSSSSRWTTARPSTWRSARPTRRSPRPGSDSTRAAADFSPSASWPVGRSRSAS